MTRSAPIDPARSSGAPTVGVLERWKLLEPVRLYLWPVAALVLVSGLVSGIRDGEWLRALLFVAFAVLVWTAAEAARASVYCPRSVVQAAMRARSQ